MKKKKDGEEEGVIRVLTDINDVEHKLEDETNYFANDTVDFKEKANYEGRDEAARTVIGPEGPAAP